jgi:hypothetical protein
MRLRVIVEQQLFSGLAKVNVVEIVHCFKPHLPNGNSLRYASL